MSFFRKKSLFILLIGIMLLVVLVGYSLTDRDNLSTPEKFLRDAVGSVQNVIQKPVTYMTSIFSNLEHVKNTYDENKILREKLAEYKPLIYDVQELEKENKDLREILDIVDSQRDYDPIIATVISRSPERWLEHVTINAGSLQGVKKDMAVITSEGMIGKVISESALTSSVQLLTGFDQFNQISATVSRKKGGNIFGLIEGYDKEKEALIFRVIDAADVELEEGELVLSSSKGGVFPDGLLLGTVKETIPDQYGLTKTVLVTPAANMNEINQVIVVDRTLPVHDGSVPEVEEEELDDQEAENGENEVDEEAS